MTSSFNEQSKPTTLQSLKEPFENPEWVICDWTWLKQLQLTNCSRITYCHPILMGLPMLWYSCTELAATVSCSDRGVTRGLLEIREHSITSFRSIASLYSHILIPQCQWRSASGNLPAEISPPMSLASTLRHVCNCMHAHITGGSWSC